MSWVIIALGAAAVLAGVSIVDKTMLQNYVRTHVSLLLLIALFQGFVGVGLVATLVWTEEVTASAVAWALFSGSLFGFGGLFLIYVLSSQEVSRTVPIAQSAPIFAAILGFLFLGESLSPIHWLAVLVTASGAVLLSVRHDEEHRGVFLHRSLLLLMAGSVITAAGLVTGKVPLDILSVPLTHGFRSLGLSLVLLVASIFNTEARQEVASLVRGHSEGLWLVAFSELVLVSGGFILLLWAISIGSVGLVTAIGATRSLFVLLYSTVLTLGFRDILGENVTPRAVTVKLVSVALIVMGVGAIALGEDI